MLVFCPCFGKSAASAATAVIAAPAVTAVVAASL